MNRDELPLTRRTDRPDGTQGPPLRRPWARWDVLARGDILGGILAAVAIFFTAGPLFFGPPAPGTNHPTGFIWVAPLAGAALFVALVIMFAERERHGIARTLMAVSAVALAVAGFVFMGEVPASRVLAFYWLPAILSISGALTLMQARKASHGVEVKVRRQ